MSFNYTITALAKITGAEIIQIPQPQNRVEILYFDSRKIHNRKNSLFIALQGSKRRGEDFIDHAYQKGVRNFLITKNIDLSHFPQANFLQVNNSLEALQLLAADYRSRQKARFIGITGSNGKTIVKEWLYFLLSKHINLFRSPNSYNSQIGVPVSLSLMQGDEDLALIEAGISQPGEMQNLHQIIRPHVGILTHFGDAHQANFNSLKHKLSEKIKLFSSVEYLICPHDEFILQTIHQTYPQLKVISCGVHSQADIQILPPANIPQTIEFYYRNNKYSLQVPYTDQAARENAVYCAAFLLTYQNGKYFQPQKFQSLPPLSMRLEMKKAVNNSILINDAYSADINSLQIALDFLHQQTAGKKKILILSDFEQNIQPRELYQKLAQRIQNSAIELLIGIGRQISNYQKLFSFTPQHEFYPSTDQFLKNFESARFKHSAILLKGARKFTFERIASRLEMQQHQTRLEIDLSALEYNLNQYRSRLKPQTQIMVMVKAFAYGSGIEEIARWIEQQKVDYLAVAFADEGVELRRAGIQLPIMVMNTSPEDFANMLTYRLEPEIYYFHILKEWNNFLKQSNIVSYPVHVKLDTGMHRLGFEPKDIDPLIRYLSNNPRLKIQSIFSHLAAADDPGDDPFTRQQITVFQQMANRITQATQSQPLWHLLNSAGIERFADYQFDMVRLGIGLYGISPNRQLKIKHVSSLKTIISQIKHVAPNQTVGYNRKGKMPKGGKIATLPIGYADGLRRQFSNGNLEVWVNGNKAPVIGNICMDMTMIDITGIDAQVGDEVEIFGNRQPVWELASKINTISYEILTSISQRVKRVYFY